jgi:hypothetical protein
LISSEAQDLFIFVILFGLNHADAMKTSTGGVIHHQACLKMPDVWFNPNPLWARHIFVSGLSNPLHVCFGYALRAFQAHLSKI